MGELDAEVTVVVQLDDADRERIDTLIKALAKVETLFEVGGRWFVRRADGRVVPVVPDDAPVGRVVGEVG